MLKRAAALILIGASLTMWQGCSTSNSSRYVYAAIPAATQIVEYREDPNSGILTQLVGSPIAAGPGVQSLAVHPSKKFLYAANSAEADISLFTISSAGVLTEQTPRTPVGVGVTTPSFLEIDAVGSFLYVGNTGASNPSISVFSIDATSGSLSAVAGSPFPIGISPLNMKLAPNGNTLYVTGAGSPAGFIEVWGVTSGVLSQLPVQVLQGGANPYGLTIDPSGAFLYTANFSGNSISEYTISSVDGSLTELSGSPLSQTFSSPLSLLVDTSGKYLFVANEGSANLSAYAIGSDGSLTVLTNSPFAAATEPSFIAQDPSGKYLFVGNQSSPVIQSFRLDSTGTLTSIATYSVGNTPTSIVVSP